jgi:hypothetical protein
MADGGDRPSDELAPQRTYLDLLMREQLAMREEMSDLRRQNFNLILGALGAAGGTAIAVGAGVVSVDDGPRGLALLLIAAFADVIALGALGIVNSYKIIEAYVETSAASIREVVAPTSGHAPETEPLLRFQSRVREFNTLAFAPTHREILKAWLVSYGATIVVGLAVLVVVIGSMVAGTTLVLSPLSRVAAIGLVFLALDVVLTVAFVVGSAWSVRHQTTWDRVAGG